MRLVLLLDKNSNVLIQNDLFFGIILVTLHDVLLVTFTTKHYIIIVAENKAGLVMGRWAPARRGGSTARHLGFDNDDVIC